MTKRDGAKECVFVHIDVQGSVDRSFAGRVFVYNYRICDRYRRPVASLVLLADGNRRWRPNGFDYTLFGCAAGIRFPTAKLSDFAGRLDELLEHPNVFALVTLHTRKKPAARRASSNASFFFVLLRRIAQSFCFLNSINRLRYLLPTCVGN